MEKYSFVTKVELKNHYIYVHYELNDNTGWKRISYRANKERLLSFIDNIKEEIGYDEDRQRKIKEGQFKVNDEPLMFI